MLFILIYFYKSLLRKYEEVFIGSDGDSDNIQTRNGGLLDKFLYFMNIPPYIKGRREIN